MIATIVENYYKLIVVKIVHLIKITINRIFFEGGVFFVTLNISMGYKNIKKL